MSKRYNSKHKHPSHQLGGRRAFTAPSTAHASTAWGSSSSHSSEHHLARRGVHAKWSAHHRHDAPTRQTVASARSLPSAVPASGAAAASVLPTASRSPLPVTKRRTASTAERAQTTPEHQLLAVQAVPRPWSPLARMGGLADRVPHPVHAKGTPRGRGYPDSIVELGRSPLALSVPLHDLDAAYHGERGDVLVSLPRQPQLTSLVQGRPPLDHIGEFTLPKAAQGTTNDGQRRDMPSHTSHARHARHARHDHSSSPPNVQGDLQWTPPLAVSRGGKPQSAKPAAAAQRKAAQTRMVAPIVRRSLEAQRITFLEDDPVTDEVMYQLCHLCTKCEAVAFPDCSQLTTVRWPYGCVAARPPQ